MDTAGDTEVGGNTGSSRTRLPVRNELLCFLQQKADVMSFDQLVKICADFYRSEEIIAARTIAEQHVDKRLTRRQGASMLTHTIEDILKLCLDPTSSLPVFYAVDLNRVPPVDATHCDVAAILCELRSLRQEVRLVSQLREEVNQLKVSLADVTAKLSQQSISDVGPVAVQAPKVSFANLAAQLDQGGVAPFKKSLVVRKAVVGSSVSCKVKSVDTARTVDIFVSRLHPDTADVDLSECVEAVKGDIVIHEINCVRLKSKYEDRYSSFHVAVKVAASNFKDALDLFALPSSWPVGVYVRRYFRPRNG
jgi:hypothetical protein